MALRARAAVRQARRPTMGIGRAPRVARWCLAAFTAHALVTRAARVSRKGLSRGFSSRSEANPAFVHGAARLLDDRNVRHVVRPGDRRPVPSLVPAFLPLVASSSPALADDAPNELVEGAVEGAKKAFKILTTGADDVYDPSTEKGAKALGLAFPVPEYEQLDAVTAEDFLPFVGLFVVAVIWGVFVVPNFLDRSDGSKAYAFADSEAELPDAKVAKEQAPVLQVKRPRPASTSEDLQPLASSNKKKASPKKKRQGFS